MTIEDMPRARTKIVAQCVCDHCGHIFDVDWKCKNMTVYCPECNEEVKQ